MMFDRAEMAFIWALFLSSAMMFDRVEMVFIWVLFLSSAMKFDKSWNGIYLSFISYRLNYQPMKEERKPQYPELLFVGCLTSQQHASVSQGRICSDIFTCCHTEIEVADQTFHLTQWQYTDTGPTSPNTDPITPGAWQGSHWSANFEVTGMTRPWKNPGASGIRTRDLPLSRRTP